MKEMKFEQAIKELETIVSAMEAGELSLDESLQKYEEGIKLAHFCKGKLESAEKKIEILQKRADGSVEIEDFDKNESKPEPAEAKEVKEAIKPEVVEEPSKPEPVAENQDAPKMSDSQPVEEESKPKDVPSSQDIQDIVDEDTGSDEEYEDYDDYDDSSDDDSLDSSLLGEPAVEEDEELLF